MKSRILSLSESGKKNSLPLSFFHTDSTGRTCVNGLNKKILLTPPGEDKCYVEGVFAVCLSAGLFPLPDHGFLLIHEDGVLLECNLDEEGETLCEVIKPGFAVVSGTVEFWEPLKAGILTVSDKGSRKEREDTSGPALAEALKNIGGIPVERAIVPDDISDISTVLKRWTIGETPMDLVLTTGGTGLSNRDVTPEAISGLPGKDVPGLSEYMRWKTSAFTLRSILSRSLAKLVGQTLVIALPGSRKGALQCFESVAPVLRHAVETASGRGGECGGH